MTFLLAIAFLLLAASVLLVLAGRESLQIKGFPEHRVHDLGDLVHLASVGWTALNSASNAATRKRMNQPF